MKVRWTAALTLCFLCWTAAAANPNHSPLYRSMRMEEGPYEVHIVEFERGDPNLRLAAALSGETVHGRETLEKTVERLIQEGNRRGRKVAAALNADFFELRDPAYDGALDGLCVVDGELISGPAERDAFVVLEDRTPLIGRFQLSAEAHIGENSHPIAAVNGKCPSDGVALITPRFDGSARAYPDGAQALVSGLDAPLYLGKSAARVVTAALNGEGAFALTPNSAALVGRGAGADFLRSADIGDPVWWTIRLEPMTPAPIAHAVGGAVRLLRDGKTVAQEYTGYSERFVQGRHPRSAVGYNATRIFLVAVDGRQPGYSAGMSLPMLASLMRSLGAADALNLDGGGSTTLWADGAVRNRPSDGSPRPIANALVVYDLSENASEDARRGR